MCIKIEKGIYLFVNVHNALRLYVCLEICDKVSFQTIYICVCTTYQ